MIVTISGIPGSGKSTIGRKLAEAMGDTFYAMGDLRRKMAERMGITLEQLNELGEKDPSTDAKVDEYQKQLGQREDNFVIDGRTSFHFIPHSLKLYIKADLKVCARRILGDKRSVERFSTEKETVLALKKRMHSDTIRYRKYYGIDCYDESNYDEVIDTTSLTEEGAIARVIGLVRKRAG